jgi:hypothetical protein
MQTADFCLPHEPEHWSNPDTDTKHTALKIPILSDNIRANCQHVLENFLQDQRLDSVGRFALSLSGASPDVKEKVITEWLKVENPVDVLAAVAMNEVHAWWPYMTPVIDQLVVVENLTKADDLQRLTKLNAWLCLSQRIDILKRLSITPSPSRL